MATKGPKREDAPRTRSALQWAAILLGLYVTMHLAAGALIWLVTGRDASEMIAPGGSSATSVAATSAASEAEQESSEQESSARAYRPAGGNDE